MPTPTTPRPHDNQKTAGAFIASQNQKDLASVVAADGGQLNPNWVEWLMGWPIGWTSLEPMSKQKFAAWQDGIQKWWDKDPAEESDANKVVPRVAKGIKKRIDRLKAIGNGQVPMSVQLAWNTLMTSQ